MYPVVIAGLAIALLRAKDEILKLADNLPQTPLANGKRPAPPHGHGKRPA